MTSIWKNEKDKNRYWIWSEVVGCRTESGPVNRVSSLAIVRFRFCYKPQYIYNLVIYIDRRMGCLLFFKQRTENGGGKICKATHKHVVIQMIIIHSFFSHLFRPVHCKRPTAIPFLFGAQFVNDFLFNYSIVSIVSLSVCCRVAFVLGEWRGGLCHW